MRAFRHLMEAFFNPLFLILLIFFLLLFLLHRERKTRYLNPLVALFFLMIMLGTSFIPATITHTLENKYSVLKTFDPSIHWIVVMGGGQAEGDDKPPNMMLYGASIKRLVEGIRIYHQLPAAQLILASGGIKQETPEAQRLAILTAWFNIPQKDVVLEKTSLNTAETAKEIKKIVGFEPFYLVTSAIHMKRAIWLCQHQGLNPIAAPTDFTHFWEDERWEKRFIPNAYNLVYLTVGLHEILGFAWSKILDKISFSPRVRESFV